MNGSSILGATLEVASTWTLTSCATRIQSLSNPPRVVDTAYLMVCFPCPLPKPRLILCTSTQVPSRRTSPFSLRRRPLG
jgi:hypothetical protein